MCLQPCVVVAWENAGNESGTGITRVNSRSNPLRYNTVAIGSVGIKSDANQWMTVRIRSIQPPPPAWVGKPT